MESLKKKLLEDKVIISTSKAYKLNRYFKENLEDYFQNECFKSILKKYEDIKEAIYVIYNKLDCRPKCPYCKSDLIFSGSPLKGYSRTCGSKECVNKLKDDTRFKNNPEDPYGLKKAEKTRNSKTEEEKNSIKNKRKQTCLLKYGSSNVMQISSTKEKLKNTLLEKYGVDNISKLDEIQKKKEETNLKHWGSKSFVGTGNWKEKTAQSNLEKYGYENAMKDPTIAKKCHESLVKGMQERYGVDHSYQIEGVKEKAIESKEKTCEKKYGVKNYFESEAFTKTMQDRYGVNYTTQSPELLKKAEHTKTLKYGVPYLWQDPEKYKQFKNILKNKYGKEFISQVPEFKSQIKESRENNNLEKYGVKVVTQLPKVVSKMLDTRIKNNKKKYGYAHFLQTEEFKQKARSTTLKRYGVDHPFKSKEIQSKIRSTWIDHYGVDHPMKNSIIHQKALSHKGMTQPEKKVNEFLTNRGFDFIYQYTINGKCFDFAIFKDGILNTLIEIDGEYNHGLLSDLDGKHVNALYDDERFTKVPEGVKLIISDSLKLDALFTEILKVFEINYSEWIKSIVNSLSKEFPYYYYSEERLKKDYKKLCDWSNFKPRSRIADSSIKNFHKSIYEAHIKNHISPLEAWTNKDLLEKCVRNRFIYSSSLSSHSVLQGFNVCKIAPKVSVFSASLAKNIVQKYLKEYKNVFDPFSGFSGRMLGVCASGKHYIGRDINSKHILESKLIKDFHQLDADLKVAAAQENKGEYDCLFTCPPYGDKEIWNENEDIKSCDEWIDICLNNYKCKKYVFVVDDTFKYQNYVVDSFNNYGHFGNTKEKILII